MTLEPGWHHYEGDPPDTVRAWNGKDWLGAPTVLNPRLIGGLGRWCVGVFVALGFILMLSVLVRAFEIRDVNNVVASSRRGQRVGLSRSIQNWLDWIELLSLLGYLVGVVVFLMWFSRAYQNLRVIRGATRLQGWRAVAAWLIPGVNLVYPFWLMQELAPFSGAGAWVRSISRPMLAWWWALYLGSSVAGVVLEIWSGSDLDAGMAWRYVAIAITVIELAALCLILLFVRRISSYQDRRLRPAE